MIQKKIKTIMNHILTTMDYKTWPYHGASFCCQMFGCFAPSTLFNWMDHLSFTIVNCN